MATATGVQDVLLRALECTLCLLQYDMIQKLPQILLCGHTFCKVCINNEIDDKTLKCPICRQQSEREQITTNFTLMGMLEHLCVDCSQEKWSKTCLHCANNICTSCHCKHMRQFYAELQSKVDDLNQDLESAKDVLNDSSAEMNIRKRESDTTHKLQSHVDYIKCILDELQADMEFEISCYKRKNLEILKIWKEKAEAEAAEADCFFQGVKDQYASNYTYAKHEEIVKESKFTGFFSKIVNMFKDADTYLTSFNRGGDDVPTEHLITVPEDDMLITRKQCDKYSAKLKDIVSSASEITVTMYDFTHDEIIKTSIKEQFGQIVTSKEDRGAIADDEKSTVIQKSIDGPSQTLLAYHSPVTAYCTEGHCSIMMEHRFKEPCGVAISSEGCIIVSERKNHRIKVFNKNMQLQSVFGRKGVYGKYFDDPEGICLTSTDELLVCDVEHDRIQVMSLEGKCLKMLDNFLGSPVSCTYGKEGVLYVCFETSPFIRVFGQAGTLIRSFGNDDELLECCYDIAITQDDKLLVTSNYSYISVFSITGEYLGRYPPTEMGSNFNPRGIALDNEGNIIVSDFEGDRLVVMNSNGVSICSIGTNGPSRGQLRNPWGIAVDHQGNVVVADSGNNRIQIFKFS